MDSMQEANWREAQKITFTNNLVAAAQRQLQFLAAVDRRRSLYEDSPVLARAIHRYKTCWLPLLAKHTEIGVVEGTLVVPLDCEWIWHCHRLNPVQYKKDCEKVYGRILGNENVESSFQAKPECQTAELWAKLYPEEPFELDFGSSFSHRTAANMFPGAEGTITYDLVSAVKRQSSFYYQVKLFYGKRLEYEHKNFKDQSEGGSVTVVEFSAEHPYGKAVALFDLKAHIVMINEEWFALPGIVLAFILSDILKKGGNDAPFLNGGNVKETASFEVDVDRRNPEDIVSNTSHATTMEAAATVLTCASATIKSGSCGSGCGECGTTVKSGQTYDVRGEHIRCSGGCGSGCGGGCANAMRSGACGGSGCGGGCGRVAKSGGCGSGCGGGCGNGLAGAKDGGCGAGCNGCCGNGLAGAEGGGCGSGCGGGCGNGLAGAVGGS